MSEAAAAIVLAFIVGVMLGIGVATAEWSLIFGAAALLFVTVCYYRNFVNPRRIRNER